MKKFYNREIQLKQLSDTSSNIVAINDLDKRLLIVEVKRQSKRYSHNKLVMKSAELLAKLKLKNYSVGYQCFSLDNLNLLVSD